MAALAAVPRPALQRPKSGTFDRTDLYSFKMLSWRDSILRQAREELMAYKEYQNIELYINYLDGEWYSSQRPTYRSNYYDNYLADQRRESLAALSDIRPTLDIKSKVDAYKGQGKTADHYVRHLWFHENLDLKIVTLIDHALFGTGFMKQVAGTNYFSFSAHGLDQVQPVLCNGDIQQSAAVVYRNYHGLPYFQAKFGREKCIGLEQQAVRLSRSLGQETYSRPDSINEYTWNAMSPAMKRRMSLRRGPVRDSGNSYDPFPQIELLEIYVDDWSINESDHDVWVHHPDLGRDAHNYHYIVPPGARLYPRKRLVIFAGDRVMYDGPSPFWHGLYPFSMLQLNPCVWSPGGISKYRDLIPLCRSVNRIGAGVDEAVMRALSGNVIGRRGSMAEDVWDAIIPSKPGQKILMNPNAQPGDLKWMEPPILPTYIMDFLRYNVGTIQRRSGSIDIQGMSRKKQMPGGEAIEQMRDAQSAPFRLEGRYLEIALEQGGVQTLSNIFQYATVDNRLSVLGADGLTIEDFDYYANSMVPASAPKEDHWKQFAFKIAPGSAHGNSRTQRKQEAFIMHREGGLSMQGLYEATEFPANWEIEKGRLKEERESGIGVPPQKGRTPRTSRSQRNGSPV